MFFGEMTPTLITIFILRTAKHLIHIVVDGCTLHLMLKLNILKHMHLFPFDYDFYDDIQ